MKSAIALVVVSIIVLGSLVLWQQRIEARKVPPLIHTQLHAHNDYSHQRPLVEALDARAMGIEADIHLVENELYVAHKTEEIVRSPERTLQAMYLDPLRKLIEQNHGSVYGDAKPVMLLID